MKVFEPATEDEFKDYYALTECKKKIEIRVNNNCAKCKTWQTPTLVEKEAA